MDILTGSPKSIDISTFPKSICFSFYTPKEIQVFSCAEIFCPVFFDIHGNVVKGGLCDERMGIFSKFGTCKFCKGNYTTCPGHFGYIDLPIPLSNNFLRNILFTIIKARCLFCNFFKTKNFETIMISSQLYEIFSQFKNREKIDDCLNLNLKFPQKNPTIFNSFYIIQNLARKNIEKVRHKTIQKKIISFRVTENPVEFAKNLSIFLINCKERSNCPKCGFDPYKQRLNLVKTKFSVKFFRKKKEENWFSKKNRKEHKIGWLSEIESEVSINEICQKNINDFSTFQFKEDFENLWKFENDFCNLFLGKLNVSMKFQKTNGFHLFFLNSILIPPNRFRPVSSTGKTFSSELILTNPQNFYYCKILKANQLILLALATKDKRVKFDIGKKSYLSLEIAFNNLGDAPSNKSKKKNPIGIKQQLEKKNGIFRMHLMGKRVFYSARSIIVPDPFLRSYEIGIPSKFSNNLSLPTEINTLNFRFFLNSVLTSCDKYSRLITIHDIENLIGHKMKIDKKAFNNQKNFLNMCLKHSQIFSIEKKKVYGLNRIFRNLIQGDIVLMNRQPSLHRVSMMSHKIRIEPNTKCLKLNYCNCNSYNADFDGDEMNLHVPQSFLAKTEAKLLSICSNQFKIPVNENPIRGLIQDYILSSVILTRKDTFVNLRILMHLLNFSENIEESILSSSFPAILKPIQLWTGKQVISILIKNFSKKQNFKVLESRTRLSKLSIGIDETKVLIRKGELLRGVMDSSQLGKNKFGVLHAYYEINGGEKGDFFLSEIGSILIIFLRVIGYTLTIEDLLLLSKIERYRKIGVKKINSITRVFSRKFLSVYGLFYLRKKKRKTSKTIFFTRFIHFINNLFGIFIQSQKNYIINLFSKNLELCIPGGLFLKPSLNKFSLITLSGAKGSILNTFQLSMNLGQTELESKCTPRNLGGKTLPVFFPFETNALSNGFIFNRFITGLNQSDFFFHCMAGREGLLDTAVKTSQSGYIQRSLIKHLESIILSYDQSVRFSKGFVNQFIYSKNGCSTMSSELKTSLNWILQNFCSGKVERSKIKIPFKEGLTKTSFFMNLKNLQSLPKIDLDKVKSFFKKNKGLRKIITILNNMDIVGKIFLDIFRKNLLIPGEPLGITTGQSIGEPCTQMTLNTFHFAGKLDSNQKTGVPRLKEILLLGSKFPVTPTMSGKINNKVKSNKFSILQMRFKRVKFDDLISCFSSFIEKNKDFEGHIIRFSFQKKLFFKHLLSIRTKTLKKIIENFGTKIKKKFLVNLKRHFKKVSELSNNLINPNTRKFDNQLSKKRLNLITNESSDKNFELFKVCIPYFQSIPNPINLNKIFSGEFNLKATKGISECFIDRKDKTFHLKGINFFALWKNNDIIEIKNIFTNDIYGMMIHYGIEASRNCLFNELESIFKNQGIIISTKHFDFISDYMTRLGNFRSFNRNGLKEEDGFQEITYETAINYIIASSLSNKTDDLTTVSSRLSLGRLINVGTGCFGIKAY